MERCASRLGICIAVARGTVPRKSMRSTAWSDETCGRNAFHRPRKRCQLRFLGPTNDEEGIAATLQRRVRRVKRATHIRRVGQREPGWRGPGIVVSEPQKGGEERWRRGEETASLTTSLPFTTSNNNLNKHSPTAALFCRSFCIVCTFLHTHHHIPSKQPVLSLHFRRALPTGPEASSFARESLPTLASLILL